MGNVDYKCPNCGGTLKFDATVQKVVCEYCGAEFNANDVKKYNEDNAKQSEEKLEWQEDKRSEFSDAEAASLNVYTCNSCGGEIIADENTTATTCPFCGNPVILKGRLEGGLKPDYIIPFKNTKDDLNATMGKYLKKKLFLPGKFKSQNQIEEIKGVYVPFWIHDADADGTIRYKGMKKRVYRAGDYRVTEKSYYAIIREGNIGFDHIPVDGSKAMPDKLMESIEPFNFSEAVGFQAPYLTGFLADKYDVTKEEVFPRVNTRIKEGMIDQFRTTISSSYSEVKVETTNIHLYNTKVSYALYPVWMMSTRYKDKPYTFAMNGQTNKMTGNLPCSAGKYLFWFFFLYIIMFGAIFGLLFLLMSEFNYLQLVLGGILGLIVPAIVCHCNRKALKPVKFQRGAANYYRKDSMHITNSEDNFLYKTVSKERISSK